MPCGPNGAGSDKTLIVFVKTALWILDIASGYWYIICTNVLLFCFSCYILLCGFFYTFILIWKNEAQSCFEFLDMVYLMHAIKCAIYVVILFFGSALLL